MLSLNKWTQVVSVIQEHSADIYINGRLENRTKVSTHALNNNLTIQIGGNSFVPSREFYGSISEVFLLERVLSADEIAGLHEKATSF
jgi:hypothetical protein